jgi:glycopeptide antibiotics resistance protein
MKKQKPGDTLAQNTADKHTRMLLGVYLIALFWILIFKLGVRFSYMDHRTVNLIPYQDYFLYGHIDRMEVIMNILIFVPAGLYAGLLLRKLNFLSIFLLLFAMSLCLEILQFVFRIGAFDATDLVNNTLGGLLGYAVIYLSSQITGSKLKVQKVINLLAIMATLIMVILLILLKLNKLPIRYQ